MIMKNLGAVSHSLCMHCRGPKNFGEAGAHHLGRGVVDALHIPTPSVLPYQIWSLQVKLYAC